MWIKYSNFKIFQSLVLFDIGPNGGIWKNWKFVGCADAIWNFGILQIGLKSDEILPNQNLRYHDRKLNINWLQIYWEHQSFTDFTDTKRISQEFWSFDSCTLLEITHFVAGLQSIGYDIFPTSSTPGYSPCKDEFSSLRRPIHRGGNQIPEKEGSCLFL